MTPDSLEKGILRIIEPTSKSIMLDDERESFCRNIVARNGIEKSYNMAFGVTLNEYDANNMAVLLLENREVMLRVNQLEKERIVYRNLTKESLVVGLKEIHDVSIADYFNDEMTSIKSSDKWTESMRLAAKKIKFGKFGVEFEIVDKMAVADKIINMMGYVIPEQKEIHDSGLAKYTDKELAEMAGVDVDFKEVKNKKR